MEERNKTGIYLKEEYERLKKMLLIITKNRGMGYYLIRNDNDEIANQFIDEYEESLRNIDQNIKVLVFDYEKDVPNDPRYNERTRTHYIRYAQEFYLADHGLEKEDLKNTVVFYRHLENYILEGDSSEERMTRLMEYLGSQNMWRESNLRYRLAFYMMPSWLYIMVIQNCPDFYSQRQGSYALASMNNQGAFADELLPEWYREKKRENIQKL